MPLALLPLPPNATNFIFSVRNQIEKWGVYEFGWEKNTPLISSYGNRDRWRERGTSPTFFFVLHILITNNEKTVNPFKKMYNPFKNWTTEENIFM